MSAKDIEIPKIGTSNTKKEMLEAYNLLKARIKEQAKSELKPEKAQKEKRKNEVVQAADDAVKEGVVKKVYDLKDEIGRALSDLANKLDIEKSRYTKLKEAIDVKKQELQETFEIEAAAFDLAALLEAQKQKKAEFEQHMAQRQQSFNTEIKEMRAQWEKEQTDHAEAFKEEKKEQDKLRKREKEEYEYTFKREKDKRKAQFNDEMEKLDKELKERKTVFEKSMAERDKELKQREKMVADAEKQMQALQKEVDSFPQEMDKRVAAAVKENSEQIKGEARKNEALLLKGFEGEKNVLLTKIESLENTVAIQKVQIEKLSQQLDNSYSKVQDIAVQAVSHRSRSSQSLKGQEVVEE